MLIRTLITALTAAAAAISTPAAAKPPKPSHPPVTARWDADTGRYCVRATFSEAAAMTGTRIYVRECLSEAKWRARGVTFLRPGRVPLGG